MNAAVVLNYNEFNHTKEMIERLKNCSDIQYVVVVDNKSTDGSYDKLCRIKQNGVFILQAEYNRGYAAGNNIGIKFIENNLGDVHYVLITNPDIELINFSMNECIKELKKDQRLALIAPKVKNLDGEFVKGWKIPTYYRMIYRLLFRPIVRKMVKNIPNKHITYWDNGSRLIYTDCLSGCFFIASMKTMEDIEYFDENTFLYGEESILGFKIKRKGLYCAILKDQEVLHMESISINNNIKSKKRKATILLDSRLYYMSKYMRCNFILCNVYKLLYWAKYYARNFMIQIV